MVLIGKKGIGGSTRRARLGLFGLLLLGLAGSLVALASLSNRSVDTASAPWHEVDGTIDVTLATQPIVQWTGAAICSRSFADGPITEAHAPNIGSLPRARVWMVLQLDSAAGGVVLALGQSALDTPPFNPTTEYGSSVPGEMVQQSPDRTRGAVRFHVPLVKGDPFPLHGAEAFLSGSLAWTCEIGIRRGRTSDRPIRDLPVKPDFR
jgi:hypothetical protein